MKKLMVFVISMLLIISTGLPFLQIGSKEVKAVGAVDSHQSQEITLMYRGLERIDVPFGRNHTEIVLDIEKNSNTIDGEVQIDLPEGVIATTNEEENTEFIKEQSRIVIKVDEAQQNWQVPIRINQEPLQMENLKLHARLITSEKMIQSSDFTVNFITENEALAGDIVENNEIQNPKVVNPRGIGTPVQYNAKKILPLENDNGMATKEGVPNAKKPAEITYAEGTNERNVSSWTEFESAMTDKRIQVIHVQKDFYNARVVGWEINVIIPKRNLTIKGNGHIIDFRGIGFNMNTSVAANETIKMQVENLTLYGQNYYGPLNATNSGVSSTNAYGALVYKDVTYIGAQLTASYTWTIEFKGYVENHSTYESYVSPFDNITYMTEGRKGENNIEAKDVIFRKNAIYNGEAYAAVFVLGNSGTMTLEDDADVTMTSKGTAGENGSYALYLQGVIKTGENARLTVNGRESGGQYGVYIAGAGNGIQAANNAQVTVKTYGDRESIYMETNTFVIIEDSAELNVSSNNRGTSGSNVIQAPYANTTFIIRKKGSFNVTSDGTGNHNLLNFGSRASFEFKDAKKVNLQFTNNLIHSASRLINMTSGNLNVDVQDVKAWNRGGSTSNDQREADYHWTPMFNMITKFSGGNGTIQSASSIMNSELLKYKTEFKPQNFSRLLYSYIEDVAVAILNPLTDNITSVNSNVVKGVANPGAYVRLTGDAALPTPKIPSIIDGANEAELIDDFTVIADESGNFEVKAQEGQHFTAANNIKAFALLTGKIAEHTVKVLDETAPTGEAINLGMVMGGTLPTANRFVKNPQDTNPTNKGFTYTFKKDYSSLANEKGSHEIVINVMDDAGNTTEIPVKLQVMEDQYGITAENFNILLSELRKYDTAEKLTAFLLTNSKATAHGIINDEVVDLTKYLTVQEINKLNQMKSGKYKITLAFDLGVSKPGAKASKEFTVTVLNDEAVKPTNPENPGSGSPSEQENQGTGQTGLLKLDYAPSTFDFGTVKYGFNQVKTNAVKTASAKQWLQVSDHRADDEITSWSVQVFENHELATVDGEKLAGATITIPQGRLYNEDSGNMELVTGPLNSKAIDIERVPSIVFSANNTTNRMKNISTDVWNTTDVALRIPGGQELGFKEYSNTVTWSLVAEPTE